MLTINFGYHGESHRHSILFKGMLAHRNDILPQPFARKVITELDGNEILSDRVMLSPHLGTISMIEISGGAKGLLLIEYGDSYLFDGYFSGDSFGDNCVPYLMELASKKDFKLALNHLLDLPNIFNPVFIENDRSYVDNKKDYYSKYVDMMTCGGTIFDIF